MITIRAEALSRFVSDIFVAAGTSRVQGDRLGDSLVSANLNGHDSHGVVRVPWYVQKQVSGEFVTDQTLKIISDTPVLAVVDGQYGFGQTMAPQAVRIGIEKCKAMGLSAVALRNSGHVGRVGEWAEMAAAEGLISIHYVNAAQSLLVAPYGGVDRRFSTAPYACGIPRPGTDPLVLDFATSIVAEGKVLVASQGGKKLPDNALITPEGAMNGDPRTLYGEYDAKSLRTYKNGKGAIRAFGEHKGSGLAFMCEVLGGALTGTGAADETRPQWANGMLSFYIDPLKLDPELFFPAEVTRFVGYVKSSKPIKPGENVLVPGEQELRTKKARLADGVPLPDDTWALIIAAARSVGVDERRIQSAGAA
jgi:hydroxycarboxylate dehydrogenase B